MKSGILEIYEALSIVSFRVKSGTSTGTLHENKYKFLSASAESLAKLRM
jgi:hypothetical protein